MSASLFRSVRPSVFPSHIFVEPFLQFSYCIRWRKSRTRKPRRLLFHVRIPVKHHTSVLLCEVFVSLLIFTMYCVYMALLWRSYDVLTASIEFKVWQYGLWVVQDLYGNFLASGQQV